MERLFIYGSLQPGGPNEHVLADLDGTWQPASLRGRLIEQGWGAEMGYPALVPDERGEPIDGFLFSSADLATAWTDLDAFEGDEYARITAVVTVESGDSVQAHVYALRD
ncbi:MAG: gamma-glutamylcyclotransferase family protein [Acidobacteriota bacterium]